MSYPLSQNATCYIKPQAPKRDFFQTRLSHNTTVYIKPQAPKHYFSYPSQPEYHFLHQASNSEARLFQTPLSQTTTFRITPQAPTHDVFTALSVRIQLFASRRKLRRMTFSHPSQSEYVFSLEILISLRRNAGFAALVQGMPCTMRVVRIVRALCGRYSLISNSFNKP